MARNFNGTSSDYLDAGTPSELNLAGSSTLTLSVWVNPDLATGEGKVFAKWADAGGQFQYLLSLAGNHEVIFATTTGGQSVAQSSTQLTVGVWSHIAGVYDGSETEMRLYIDGIEEDTAGQSGGLSIANPPVRFGAGSGGSGTENPFDGDIGHGAIWNGVLSEGEIESLANGINPMQIQLDNLVGYFPLNGVSPETEIIYGNNATVNGTTIMEEPPIPNSIKAA